MYGAPGQPEQGNDTLPLKISKQTSDLKLLGMSEIYMKLD